MQTAAEQMPRSFGPAGHFRADGWISNFPFPGSSKETFRFAQHDRSAWGDHRDQNPPKNAGRRESARRFAAKLDSVGEIHSLAALISSPRYPGTFELSPLQINR